MSYNVFCISYNGQMCITSLDTSYQVTDTKFSGDASG